MNFTEQLTRLLDANPGMTELDIQVATGWDKERTKATIYNMLYHGALNTLPKRYVLTETLAQREERVAAAKVAARERRNAQARARKAAARANLPPAKRGRPPRVQIPPEAVAANDEMVAIAQTNQHPLAAAWGGAHA